MIDPSWLFTGIWLFFMLPITLWSIFWKMLGLWFSAKNSDKGWFILFLFVNLLGIPEIYYLHREDNWPFS